MTQDVYLARRAVDSQAALALEAALGTSRLGAKVMAKQWPKKKASGLEGR